MDPVRSTISAAHADTVGARRRSLALRLLGGAGRASLVAYDLDPLIEAGALCHALSVSGDLVIACVRDPQVPATQWGETSLRVRLDVVKEAPESAVRITACAVHLLGELQWLPDELVPGFLAGAELPEPLVELGTGTGGRIGVVHTDRVLVHDSAGVTPLAYSGLMRSGLDTLDQLGGGLDRLASFPDRDQEWAARDRVGELSEWQVAGLLDAAAHGWEAASTLSQRREPTCSHVDGQVFCVDLDRTGLTLMTLRDGETTVTFFAFHRPVDAADELIDRLDQLVETGEAVRPPRSGQATA